MKTRKMLKCVLILGLLLLGFVLYCNIRIVCFSKTRLFDSVDDVPHRHAALVLGTSPTGRSGGPNLFFLGRIKACAALYDAGKVDKILVSGDNRHVKYNEPEAMKQALMDSGIPAEDIILDYAGFRTFDSVVRAKEVFGLSSFTVVSQRFHNERAVFIAGKKAIDAIGFNAGNVGLPYGLTTYIRECFARCKVFLDLATGKKPHFLEDPVSIN